VWHFERGSSCCTYLHTYPPPAPHFTVNWAKLFPDEAHEEEEAEQLEGGSETIPVQIALTQSKTKNESARIAAFSARGGVTLDFNFGPTIGTGGNGASPHVGNQNDENEEQGGGGGGEGGGGSRPGKLAGEEGNDVIRSAGGGGGGSSEVWAKGADGVAGAGAGATGHDGNTDNATTGGGSHADTANNSSPGGDTNAHYGGSGGNDTTGRTGTGHATKTNFTKIIEDPFERTFLTAPMV